jgi:16S rRNA (guanine527-N7)-methyltransferase
MLRPYEDRHIRAPLRTPRPGPGAMRILSPMSAPQSRLGAEVARLLPELDTDVRARLTDYLQLVEQYSPALNLTAFQGAAALAFELGAESLRLLELGPIAAGARCVDLGSGVGIPVIPLAIALPEAHFTAVESRQRRSTFLLQARAHLRLRNLDVLEQRTESLIERAPVSFDVVTARAYASPAVYLQHAAALCAAGGEVRGYSGADMDEVEAAAADSGLVVEQALAYDAGGSRRHAYLLRKGGL